MAVSSALLRETSGSKQSTVIVLYAVVPPHFAAQQHAGLLQHVHIVAMMFFTLDNNFPNSLEIHHNGPRPNY